MGSDIQYLYSQIKRFGLDKRSTKAKNALMMIERGLMVESVAQAFLISLKPEFEETERRQNFLERVPRMDEIYPHGPPPVVVGKCVEDPDIPIGSFLKGPTHCLFSGTTGGGKTVGIRRFVTEIDRLNKSRENPVSIIIRDSKLDYLDLPDKLGPSWSLYDAHGLLRFGLQPPPFVPIEAWINHVASLFCARTGLIASWMTLVRLMQLLVAALNPHPTELVEFPTFEMLLEGTERVPRAAIAEKDPYLASLRQQLYAAAIGSGDMFKATRGLDLEREIVAKGRSAVIAVPSIEPDWLNHFIVDILFSQSLLSRLHSRRRVDDPEVVFVCDEADDIASRGAEAVFPQGGLSPIAKTLRQGRELGIGVVLGLGMLGSVSPQILNSATQLFMFDNSNADARITAARTLDLPRGADAIIKSLEPGECLARVPGPWRHAMLAKFDYVPPRRELVMRDDKHDFVPARGLTDMPNVLSALERFTARYRGTRRGQLQHGSATLRPETKKLLLDASEKPFWPVARLIAVTSTVRRAVLREVRDGEFAVLEDVRIGQKHLCLIELLQAGWELIDKKPVKTRGRGELPHRTFANWIVMVGQKRGYETRCEWVVPGTNHPVDAAWRLGKGWRAFEVVVTCTSNLRASLTSVLQTPKSPVTKVTIVAPQKDMLETIERDLGAEFGGKVDFVEVKLFEEELWNL